MKKLLAQVIKRIPFNNIRIIFYRKLLNYDIGNNVEIGASTINCKNVIIGDNVLIRKGNVFSCNSLIIEKNSRIQHYNVIVGNGNFKLGNNSRILDRHHFDVWNNITIGNNSFIAGKGTQLWTHGSLSTKAGKNLDIKIGNNVFIGANSTIAPGVYIADNNLVGLGSVVLYSCLIENNLIAGNPANIMKTNINWRKNW